MEHNFCFQLLKNIMLNAFQAETHYIRPPYDDTTLSIPPEIAQILYPNFGTADTRIAPSNDMPNRRLFVIKTNLEFYFITLYVNLDEPPDIILIGPFRSDAISSDDFSKRLLQHPFLSSKHTFLLNYYQNLPCVSLQNMVNTVVYIINTYMLFHRTPETIYIDFTKINDGWFDAADTPDHAIVPSFEKSTELIQATLNSIIHGNIKTAQKEMNLFLKETAFLSQKDFAVCKRNLLMINHHFLVCLCRAHIEPLNVANLYTIFIDEIERIHTRDALIKTAYDMCYDYSILFQSNTFPEYTKTINDVINYIHLHLHEPLNLSSIAKHFNKNASRLSSSFKENTGMTLTNYIQQTRINRAIDYLHSSTLSISEIALATGFQDFAYFSRTFKKHTGQSPKEYRDSQTNNTDFPTRQKEP